MATTITANGINFPDGSASSPSIGGSDTNTGLFTGADIIGFSTGGSERLRIDSSGRLLLGTTTEGQANADNLTIDGGDAETGITIRSGTSRGNHIYFSDGTSGDDEYRGIISYQHSDNKMQFFTNAAERMRIDSSGNVGIGTTSPVNNSGYGGFSLNGSSGSIASLMFNGTEKLRLFGHTNPSIQYAGNLTFVSGVSGGTERMRIHDTGEVQVVSEKLTIGTSVTNGGVSDGMLVLEFNGSTKNGIKSRANPGASESQHLVFVQNSSEVGRIHSNNSSTSYATSSDYRLKENVTAISDGITRLKTLKPSRFNFIIDPDKTVDGFLAHEVTAVPEAITGTKDEVDSDNNPVYQSIDQSKLVPLLTAALQEAVARIEALEAG